MAFNDPIAELLTKIRNAKGAQHRFVDLPFSKMKVKILEILKNHGFIENFLVNEEKYKIRVFLRYTKSRESVINGLDEFPDVVLDATLAMLEFPAFLTEWVLPLCLLPKG
jgi:small subunit ribosomal protein S8